MLITSVERGLVEVRRGNQWIVFDELRAVEVCSFAALAWQEKHKHLANCDQPELVYLPKGFPHASRLHALYLFAYGPLNRYGKTTNQALDEGTDIFLQNPWIIDPVLSFCDDDFERLSLDMFSFTSLKTVKGKKELEGKIVGWKNNLRLLQVKYDSDPRNIFYNVEKSRQSIIDALSIFYGYGQKVAQLVALYFQKVKWEEEKEQWDQIKKICVMPVDLWLAREMRNFSIVVSWSTDKKNAASYLVSDFLVYICEKYHLPWDDVAQAFWHTGANVCIRVPQNAQKASAHCLTLCPFHDFCDHRAGGSHQSNNGGFGWDSPKKRPKNLFNL